MDGIMPPSREWKPPPRETLVDQTVRSLLEGLRVGVWSGELPGERVLSDHLGVSRPTLRAALEQLQNRGLLSTSRGCRRGIAADATPELLKTVRKTVGILTPIPLEGMPPFALNWIDLLRTRLARERIVLEIHCAPRCFGRSPAAALSARLARTPVSIWIIFHSTLAMQKWFQERQVPCVMAGSPFAGVSLPSVDIDYRAACRHAGGVLRQRGHARVCLLLPEGMHGGDADSIAGLSEHFSADALTVLYHDGSRRSIVARVDQALALQPVARAFVVARSAPVLTVVTRLLQRGLRLPDDAAVISRDDDAYLDFLTPVVTRYRASPATFGRYLSEICLRKIRGSRIPVHARKLLPRFVAGETI